MTEQSPSPGSLSARQKLQLVCAAALGAGMLHHYYAKPSPWSVVWVLDMVLLVGGGITGLLTLLRRPPVPPHR